MRLQLSGVPNVLCLSHENIQSNVKKYHGITDQTCTASVLEHNEVSKIQKK